ncbi:MAG: hypothetical protein NUV56_01815 [Candidatus Uhrbacteria bacterium]|nr:hypothetical protein [Candidatus Uhrbacteria bacterium]
MFNWIDNNLGLPAWISKIIFWVLLLLIGPFFIRTMCVTHVENYELGYKWNALDGTITRLSRPGYFFYPPFVQKVNTIDLRPMQVCVSANQRTLNCKLVKFNPDGMDLFLSWHGRDDYVASTTTSEVGASSTAFSNILMAYAYENAGKEYPFLTIMREMKTEDRETNAIPAAQ